MVRKTVAAGREGCRRNDYFASALSKAIGIIETNDFMMLHQIDVVYLKMF
jgi:hypothetical protein